MRTPQETPQLQSSGKSALLLTVAGYHIQNSESIPMGHLGKKTNTLPLKGHTGEHFYLKIIFNIFI